MKRSVVRFAACAFAAMALLTPCHVTEGDTRQRQIIVRIDDVPGGPVVTVKNAPSGYDIYMGPLVSNDAIEYGGIITIYSVDTQDTIDPGNNGWRFVDPNLPANSPSNATDIVWLQHNDGGDRSLQVGYNTLKHVADGYYRNPAYTGFDDLAGPAINKWFTVYSDKTILLQFNPHKPVR